MDEVESTSVEVSILISRTGEFIDTLECLVAILRLGMASLSRDTEKRDVFSINFRLAFNVARSEFSNSLGSTKYTATKESLSYPGRDAYNSKHNSAQQLESTPVLTV